MEPQDIVQHYIDTWGPYLRDGESEVPLEAAGVSAELNLRVKIPYISVDVLAALAKELDAATDRAQNLRHIVDDLEEENAELLHQLANPREVAEMRARLREFEADKSGYRPPMLGEILDSVLTASNTSQAGLARKMGISTKHMSDMKVGRSLLMPEMAVKLALATGIPAAVWIGIQATHMQWQATCDAD